MLLLTLLIIYQFVLYTLTGYLVYRCFYRRKGALKEEATFMGIGREAHLIIF